MKICLYEDEDVLNLSPLNLLRHTSELICGAFTTKQRTENFLPKKNKSYLLSRKYLQEYISKKFKQNHLLFNGDEDCLFLNSRIYIDKSSLQKILTLTGNKSEFVLRDNNDVICFFIFKKNVKSLIKKINENSSEYIISHDLISSILPKALQIHVTDLKINGLKKIKYCSDLILNFKEQMIDELSYEINNRSTRNKNFSKSKYRKKNKAYVSKRAKISDGVVFDSSEGIILIEDNVKIEPFVFIKGPVVIKSNTLIKANSSIYGPVYIGEHCKIAGEVAHSILHSYVNKQHHGFLGHSYLCEWINLGAGTTTSNLKNNYSNIKITSPEGEINTGSIFLGSLIGDHTKTGINTMLNTGSLIGIFSNLIGSGYHKKNIPSFSWVNSDSKLNVRFHLEKAIESGFKTMDRRSVTPSEEYISLIKYLYNN